jgi:hypothetical protein
MVTVGAPSSWAAAARRATDSAASSTSGASRAVSDHECTTSRGRGAGGVVSSPLALPTPSPRRDDHGEQQDATGRRTAGDGRVLVPTTSTSSWRSAHGEPLSGADR